MHEIADAASPSASAECRILVEAAADLRSVARGLQDEIERERRIPPPLVEQLRAAGFYSMVIPRELGGRQVDLTTFLRVGELMAEGDASVGCGGYLVSGRWPFGSGCRESQWMLANFEVQAGDQLRQNADGTPALYRGYFHSAECTVIDSWDMTGMRGTGSHDWTVTDVFVPEHRTVHVDGRLLTNQWHRWPGTLYALPVHALVGPHHSVVATGIARAGIDTLTELAGAKVPRGRTGLLRENAQVQESVARAEALLGAAQTFRAAACTAIWETVAAGHETTLQQRARCRLAASFAVDSARQAMDLMYRAGGTTSSKRTHRLARCWRDLHVVAQAASVTPDWYPLVGRAFLGLDTEPRLL